MIKKKMLMHLIVGITLSIGYAHAGIMTIENENFDTTDDTCILKAINEDMKRFEIAIPNQKVLRDSAPMPLTGKDVTMTLNCVFIKGIPCRSDINQTKFKLSEHSELNVTISEKGGVPNCKYNIENPHGASKVSR